MSKDPLTIAIAVLSVLGLALAGYLTYVHYFGLAPICFTNGGCEIVQSSKYATQFGIPVPILGLVGYALMLGSLLIKGELGRLSGMIVAVGGFFFSTYLTYLELFKIHAICTECVTSYGLVTIIAVLMTVRYLRSPGGPAAAEAEAD